MRKKLRKCVPLILVGIVVLIGFPLLRDRMLEGHDGVFQLFRNYTTKIALLDDQYIPMVNPNMMGGFGYASNLFYGILSTYIITFFSVFTSTIGLAVNIFILVTIFLSGLFMYFFVNVLSRKKEIALLSGILYMTSPYFLYDLYVRMALGEIVSFVFLPLLFHGLYNIINGDKRKWYLLTIGTSGLFLSHSISTLMCAIFAGIYLLLNFKKVTEKEVIKKILLALGCALLLSLPTIFPLLEAKFSSDYMVFDTGYMKTNGINMEKNSIRLFSNLSKTLSYLVHIYMIVIVLIGILLFHLKKKNRQLTLYYILMVVSILLTLNIIPWSHLPSLFSTFQFPWRFLQLSSFFFAITLALLYQELNVKKHVFFITIIGCFILIVPFIKIGIQNPGIDNQLVYSNKLKKRGDIVRSTGTASAEYLPRNAIYNYEYLKNRSLLPTILEGKGTVSRIQKKGTHLSFLLKITDSSIVELPYIYYPGYLVKANDKALPTFETQNGMVGVSLKKGNYQVKSFYRGSNIMIFAYITSIVSLIMFILLILKQKNWKASL